MSRAGNNWIFCLWKSLLSCALSPCLSGYRSFWVLPRNLKYNLYLFLYLSFLPSPNSMTPSHCDISEVKMLFFLSRADHCPQSWPYHFLHVLSSPPFFPVFLFNIFLYFVLSPQTINLLQDSFVLRITFLLTLCSLLAPITLAFLYSQAVEGYLCSLSHSPHFIQLFMTVFSGSYPPTTSLKLHFLSLSIANSLDPFSSDPSEDWSIWVWWTFSLP